MDPLVKGYLLTHSFQQLEDDHGVNVRFSAGGDKCSLNYDQLNSKGGDLLAEQCRGMVVRPTQFVLSAYGDAWKSATVGNVDILAWPMNRFYNYGDGHVAPVDWSDTGLRVYEKVDGTCIILYWDPLQHRWHAGTRAVPEADLPIHNDDIVIGNMTFSQLFWQALWTTVSVMGAYVPASAPSAQEACENIVNDLNKEMTYVFELVSPYNQVVVTYTSPRVYLLAARHTATGVEVPIEQINMEYVFRPKTWQIKDVLSLSSFVDQANPSELEGAVACDSRFNRMKVKNKSYVLAHKSKDSVTSSPRNALAAVLLEKVDDIAPLVPKDVGDRLFEMQDNYVKYCKQIDTRFAEFVIEAAGVRKRFAEQVMLSGDMSAVYFSMWEKKVTTAREWFKTSCEKSKLSDSSLDSILVRLAKVAGTK